MRHSSTVGLLLLAGLALLWGVSWPMMKIVLNEVPPLTFRALVAPVGGGFVTLLAVSLGQTMRVPEGRWWPLITASTFNMVGWFVPLSFGLVLLPSGQAAIVAYTMPVWATILAVWILQEPFSLRRGVALVGGMASIALLALSGGSLEGATPVGIGLVTLAAISWAIGSVIQRRVRWGMPLLSVVAWQLLLSAVPLVPLALLVDGLWLGDASPLALAAMGYNILIAVTFGYFIWFRMVALFPVSVASITLLIIPVVGVISGALILGEAIGWAEVAALVLVCGAVALVLGEGRRAGAHPP